MNWVESSLRSAINDKVQGETAGFHATFAKLENKLLRDHSLYGINTEAVIVEPNSVIYIEGYKRKQKVINKAYEMISAIPRKDFHNESDIEIEIQKFLKSEPAQIMIKMYS